MGKKLLEMIENVSPDDTDTLDEIDVRTWCWLRGYKFNKFVDHVTYGRVFFYSYQHTKKKQIMGWRETFTKVGAWRRNGFLFYTRSRDALKAIRPEGWAIEICTHYDPKDGAWGKLVKYDCDLLFGNTGDNTLPTEELAELHAIIQVTEYERQANNTMGKR